MKLGFLEKGLMGHLPQTHLGIVAKNSIPKIHSRFFESEFSKCSLSTCMVDTTLGGSFHLQ